MNVLEARGFWFYFQLWFTQTKRRSIENGALPPKIQYSNLIPLLCEIRDFGESFIAGAWMRVIPNL